MAAALCFQAPDADAAEIRSTIQTPKAEDYESPYKKKIPGTTNKIAGSRPRTYLKPEKQTYQQHMQSLKTHRFKNESESFGYGRKSAPSSSPAAAGSSRVITSTLPPSSRIKVQQHAGRPAAGLSRNQPLSQSDFLFLSKMSDVVKTSDPSTASRLASIMLGQKEGRTLSKDEYDYLQSMAARVDDGQAAYRLRSIAEKRREKLY